MGLVPDTYIFTKTSNGNIELSGYKDQVIGPRILVELYSLSPVKDIRISQSYPESIVIPVDSIGNHVDNKFVAIPWERIDFEHSNPSSSPLPTTIFEAVQALGASFFLAPPSGMTAKHDWQNPYSYMGRAPIGTVESATGSWDDRTTLIYT
jgi:hypothetical protein